MADPDARTAPRRSWWRTAFADVWDRRAAELRASASARDRFARGHQAGNPDVGLVWAGEGTDLITAVEPAGNLVAQIVTQTERLLRGTSRLAAPDPVRRHPRGHIAQFCTSRPKITTGSKPAPNGGYLEPSLSTPRLTRTSAALTCR
jgi:hypothetical protein